MLTGFQSAGTEVIDIPDLADRDAGLFGDTVNAVTLLDHIGGQFHGLAFPGFCGCCFCGFRDDQDLFGFDGAALNVVCFSQGLRADTELFGDLNQGIAALDFVFACKAFVAEAER